MNRIGQLKTSRRSADNHRHASHRPVPIYKKPLTPTPLKNKATDVTERLHIANLQIRELKEENLLLRNENAILHKQVEHQSGLVRKLVIDSQSKQRLQAVLARMDQDRPGDYTSPTSASNIGEERLPFTPQEPPTPSETSPDFRKIGSPLPSQPEFESSDFSSVLDEIDAVIGKSGGANR